MFCGGGFFLKVCHSFSYLSETSKDVVPNRNVFVTNTSSSSSTAFLMANCKTDSKESLDDILSRMNQTHAPTLLPHYNVLPLLGAC